MLGTCTLLVEGMERLSLKSIDASVIVSILVVLYYDMSIYMSTDRYGGATKCWPNFDVSFQLYRVWCFRQLRWRNVIGAA